jgi:hypothetical protein
VLGVTGTVTCCDSGAVDFLFAESEIRETKNIGRYATISPTIMREIKIVTIILFLKNFIKIIVHAKVPLLYILSQLLPFAQYLAWEPRETPDSESNQKSLL